MLEKLLLSVAISALATLYSCAPSHTPDDRPIPECPTEDSTHNAQGIPCRWDCTTQGNHLCATTTTTTTN